MSNDGLNNPLENTEGADAPQANPHAHDERYSMDPAQQSLADALRITYRILQLVMILLLVLFLASGFQSIGSSERGVKLTFGKITRSEIAPGSVWNWPYPVGEILHVTTSQRSLNLQSTFFPLLTADQESRSREQLAFNKPSLQPGYDGSLITADGNIAHTRWQIAYRVKSPAMYLSQINEQDITMIVSAAVSQGVVRAAAEIELDALLKQVASADGENASSVSILSSRVRSIAQSTLDAVESGIVIDEVILTEKTAPFAVLSTFNDVTTAASRAGQEREAADQFRQTALNEAAGLAHAALLERIDDYERATELGDDELAEQVLEQINRIFDGEPVVVDGVEVTVSGDVTTIINNAKQYRTTAVSSARSASTSFKAKLESYRNNPRVFLVNEYREAYEAFIANNGAEIEILPAGTDLSLILNRDPQIGEDLERERNARQAETTIAERNAEVRAAQQQRQEESNQ